MLGDDDVDDAGDDDGGAPTRNAMIDRRGGGLRSSFSLSFKKQPFTSKTDILREVHPNPTTEALRSCVFADFFLASFISVTGFLRRIAVSHSSALA